MTAIYNYYSGNFSTKSLSRYYYQEKDDRRKIYSSILSINLKSPLYMIKDMPDKEQYALGVKESAMLLNSSLAAFLDHEELFLPDQKIQLDRDGEVEISILEDNNKPLPDPFTIQVSRLASPQINTGCETYSSYTGLLPGDYTFIVKTDENQYEFQYHLHDSSDSEIQKKLASFINQAQIGIYSEVLTSPSGNRSSLRLTSSQTGYCDEPLFQVLDKVQPEDSPGISEYYELNTITTPSQSSEFLLNNEPKESLSNTFILGGALTVNLLNADNQKLSVSYKNDYDKLTSSVSQLLEEYNNLINFSSHYIGKQNGATKLEHSLTDITALYNEPLETFGILSGEDNKLYMDKPQFLASVSNEDINESLSSDKGYLRSLLNKTKNIMINPMEYVDKIVVTYPNLLKSGFPNPYTTSAYCGMLFNYYC